MHIYTYIHTQPQGTGHLTNAGSMADPGLAARQARQRAMQAGHQKFQGFIG